MSDEGLKSINRLGSLDRDDLSFYDVNLYPKSYQIFQNTIENAFFKSELLLKCKMEFERLIKVDLSEPMSNRDVSVDNLNLTLVFTGAIKSGRSSIINMLLNTRVLPVNVLGSSCCVKIFHPKDRAKHISVGTYDWDGWELDKMASVEIEELPKKIEEMQRKVLRESMKRNNKLTRRLHVQLPHWLLKNIDIYKCSPIDGMYSFDEPFDIIQKTKNTILMHVIDASNGLMEWDRTFLSQIQYKSPQLPIFFIINHIDIQFEVLVRDRCIRFGSTPEKPKSELFESESDQTSTDETLSERLPYSEENITKQQSILIEKTTKQITNLGFALEKSLTIYYASLSAKEFSKLIKKPEKDSVFHLEKFDQYFQKLNKFLDAWMEKMLITSSLKLKCQINGVVDATLCQIMYPNSLSQDLTNDIYIQQIKKAEKNINESFNGVIVDLEHQVMKIVREQVKRNEDKILKSMPVLSTEDPAEIAYILKPVLIKNFEKFLIGKPSNFNINDQIHKILNAEIAQLEVALKKICKSKQYHIFTKYIYNLFIVLKKTFHFPLIVHLPEEIFNSSTKWYKEFLRVASRKIRGTPVKTQSMVHQLIDDMTIQPLIKVALMNLGSIQKDIQFFTKNYQETYKAAQSRTIEGTEMFRKLVMVDFIIQVIEKSFQKSQSVVQGNNFQRLTSFYSDFYEKNESDSMIHKKIYIQSFTSLSNAVNSLCFKRILRNGSNILSYKSTQLLRDNTCLISYIRVQCDLHTAITKQTKWSIEDIYSIMNNLICAVKYVMPYYQYIQIDLLPENIIMKKNSFGPYTCYLFPFSESTSSINYNVRSDGCKKFLNIQDAVIFQLGMVLSWIITNDLDICSGIYERSLSSRLEETILNNIRNNVREDLKKFSLDETCRQFLFHSSSSETIESLLKYFKQCQETEKYK